jgi:plastocyanin
MVITITSVQQDGKWVTQFSPAGVSIAVTDYVAWSNEDSREGPDGEHLIVDAQNNPFFDVKLLPCPPPSAPYFFSKGDIGKTYQYHCSLHDNETGSFTIVQALPPQTT